MNLSNENWNADKRNRKKHNQLNSHLSLHWFSAASKCQKMFYSGCRCASKVQLHSTDPETLITRKLHHMSLHHETIKAWAFPYLFHFHHMLWARADHWRTREFIISCCAEINRMKKQRKDKEKFHVCCQAKMFLAFSLDLEFSASIWKSSSSLSPEWLNPRSIINSEVKWAEKCFHNSTFEIYSWFMRK